MAQKDEIPKQPASALDSLSGGERECLVLVRANLGSKAIARELDISPHTVDARLKSACAKLGTNSRFVAARMLAEFQGNENVTVTSPNTNLVYQSPDFQDGPPAANKTVSAGESDGSDDHDRDRLQRLVSMGNSGREDARFKLTHSIATFFWGTNKLSVGKRLYAILIIALGVILAVGIVVNGLTGLSRMLESPKEAAPSQGG